MRHPTLRHIILIDPVPFDVLVYSRELGGEWSSLAYGAPEDGFAVDGCSASLTLQQIYRGLAIPAAAEAPPGL